MYSNCLIEAVKAKIKDPKNVKIFKVPNEVVGLHFAWTDGKTVGHAFNRNASCKYWFEPKIKKVPIEVFTRWVLSNIGDPAKVRKFAEKAKLPILNFKGILYFYTWSDDEDNVFFGEEKISKEDFSALKRMLGFEPQIKIVKNHRMKVVDFEEFLKETGTFSWKIITPFDVNFKEIYEDFVKDSDVTD